MKARDLIGKRIDKIVVLGQERPNGNNLDLLCRCDCGREVWIRGAVLLASWRNKGPTEASQRPRRGRGCSNSCPLRKEAVKPSKRYVERLKAKIRKLEERIRVLSSSLLLVGCTGAVVVEKPQALEEVKTIEVYIDPEIWQQAADDWCAIGADCLEVVPVETGGLVQWGPEEVCSSPPVPGKIGGWTCHSAEECSAWGFPPEPGIWLCPQEIVDSLGVARHELGHWLGAGHHEGPGAMTSRPTAPTLADLETIR